MDSNRRMLTGLLAGLGALLLAPHAVRSTPPQPPPPEVGDRVRIHARDWNALVNVRDAPGTEGTRILDQVQPGVRARVLRMRRAEADGRTWCFLVFERRQLRGWVRRDLLRRLSD